MRRGGPGRPRRSCRQRRGWRLRLPLGGSGAEDAAPPAEPAERRGCPPPSIQPEAAVAAGRAGGLGRGARAEAKPGGGGGGGGGGRGDPELPPPRAPRSGGAAPRSARPGALRAARPPRCPALPGAMLPAAGAPRRPSLPPPPAARRAARGRGRAPGAARRPPLPRPVTRRLPGPGPRDAALSLTGGEQRAPAAGDRESRAQERHLLGSPPAGSHLRGLRASGRPRGSPAWRRPPGHGRAAPGGDAAPERAASGCEPSAELAQLLPLAAGRLRAEHSRRAPHGQPRRARAGCTGLGRGPAFTSLLGCTRPKANPAFPAVTGCTPAAILPVRTAVPIPFVPVFSRSSPPPARSR